MIHVTRRYRFAASHRLHSPRLGPEENDRVYGKCNNPYGHGHNYVVDVSACGPVDQVSGQAIDLAALDRLVRERVLDAFDHKNLNEQVPEFGDVVPTTENLGLLIHSRLRRGWREAFQGPWPQLEKVRIHETERNIFEVSESDQG
jgi:6-pyruvoyltetrahydropterin/6-carboxytetrahydropterin synthase